ncbi:hypothetical protein BDA99DRAFT_497170 [Phascolomyces articulosus]|uniref:Membrane anchor Opy2 N-terminal domain-containing protein n=1 Tax=Phascolomyces articulosus TaxID=60185 RepID=A0AAD5PJP2_9FUNG|nr:hypothetical protein BDA99DRAFT_497170 [Phascolomyces articulosus]
MSPSDVKITRLPTRIRPQLLQRRRLLDKRNECQPSHCKPQCVPGCSSNQRCILDVMKNCGECPVSQCVSLSALGISSHTNDLPNNNISSNDNEVISSTSGDENSNNKTGLIAGLTTGLVAGAVIVVAIAGLVYFKRKRRTQQQKDQYNNTTQRQLEERVPTINNKPLGPPPAAAVLPATTMLPTDTTFWPKEAAPPSPQSPVFMGNTLQIPRLTTTPSTPPPTSTNITSPNTIRQSLSLLPSTAATSISASSSSIRPPPPMISRSSSVKLTKYDHQRTTTKDSNTSINSNDDLDDDEDQVQVRRAVSVNKRQGLSRSASLGSKTTRSATGEAVPIVYARPTMVRINTITRKENGITRKASVRTVISTSSQQNQQHRKSIASAAAEQPITLQPIQPNERRLRTESWNSQHSIANSSHSSIGDGEITVFWDAPPTTTNTTSTSITNTTTSFTNNDQ